ncbi:RNA polymerase sigma-70 factor [Bacteroides nordii]|uniref:RNA polymerase sigma-70 factor n=1 Tax=Bacteroides nordii TaxID=291645 RepID=UPI001EDD4862|nr:RNA polymerase sigma-70 factor [Bacteroides nordii]MCG4768118.1 RNA polymerase sigma-70 factor [Bacteroides nordii]
MDKKYIIGLQKGSYSDFNKLYDLYTDRLYGFAYNLTHSSEMAEEIVQEVFLKIWQMREHLSPEYSFRSFLFTIAKNKFLNDLRNRLTLLSYDEYITQLDDATERGENSTESEFNFNELNEQVLQSKDKLSKRQKMIFEMSKEEGLSNQEIALKLGISEQSVRNQLSSALKVLREELIRIGFSFALFFMSQW